MGTDRKLADWSQVVSYFQALPHSSNRIRVRELGKTTEGRPFLAAIIAAPETLHDLDRYLNIQKRLADPRKTNDSEARKLIAEGKSVVLITCSIHSTEVASTFSAIEFAHRLLTADDTKTRAILANTIILLVPSLNPDGVDIVANWYRNTLGTPYEGTAPPELYQKYVGHDNNRDWYIFSQKETRLAVGQLHNVWHPQIVYDVHQQGPYGSRLFVPPWLDPIDPNVDPVLVQEMNSFGMNVASDLTASGKKGVVVHALYDFWTPARQYSAYHAGLRILTESASARLASPIEVSPSQIESHDLGFNPRESSWNYPEPWTGGAWRLRDIIDYQLLAMESLLFQAAQRREELLRNFYEIGKRAVSRQTPFAFVIPLPQRDPEATRRLIGILRFGLVEIQAAKKEFRVDGKRYPEGSMVIKMQQPYSSFAKTLLERQHYPDLRLYRDGPPQRPYDVTAQTLPLLMGVTVQTVEHPFDVPLTRDTEIPDDTSDEILPAADTQSWVTVNKLLAAGKRVWRDPESGNFLTHPLPGQPDAPLTQPRIGLYRSWVPAMDEGWTRWLFDTFGFVYTNLHNADLEAVDLRRSYDVIVFPDQRSAEIAGGFASGSMPPEFTGGVGEKACVALRHFAESGGVLIFLNRSSQFAAEHLGLKVVNVVHDLPDREFYSPGSLLNVTLDAADPLHYGLPGSLPIWNEQSPAWEIPTGDSYHVVAKYTPDGVLASGWLLGEPHIQGKAAVLRIEVGKGQIVLFGMRPQYRAQSHLTFKLFFNSLFLGSR